MRELANLLAEGPEMAGYRKLLKTHPVLSSVPGELAARPVIEKVFYKGKPGVLSAALASDGVDGLFAAIGRLDNGKALQLAYVGMRILQDGMDDIKKMQEGEDSEVVTQKRRDEIAKLAEG